MSEPVLSIVTVALDHADGVRRTMRSILDQRGAAPGSWEWVVMDGGSTDGTLDVLAEARTDPHVRVTSEPDDGIYDAMNKGWRASRGRWCQFLNAGDVLADLHVLAETVERLSHAEAPWLVARTQFVDADGHHLHVSDNVPHRRWRHVLGLTMQAHPSTYMRRELIAQLGGFSSAYGVCGDYHLVLRAAALSPAETWPRTTVHFEPPGESARESAAIPGQLAAARRDAMPPWWRMVEPAWGPIIRIRWERYARRCAVEADQRG